MRIFVCSLVMLALATYQHAAAAAEPITLGGNWSVLETYHGATFRWVNNDAEIKVGGTGKPDVSIDCEPGPGIGTGRFILRVLDRQHRQVDAVEIVGRQTVHVFVPAGETYILHTDAGGRTIPTEKRILNFRVFSIVSGASRNVVVPDIAGPNVTIADHWYPLEVFGGETFRWVANDATIHVSSAHAGMANLLLTVERGPGMGTSPLKLTVTDGHGRATRLAPITGRSALKLPIEVDAGENTLRLKADGGGKTVASDKRILNFRVLSIQLSNPA